MRHFECGAGSDPGRFWFCEWAGKTGGGTGQSKIKVSPIDYGFTSTAPFYSGQALMSNTKNTTNTEESLDENGISLNPPHIVVNYIIMCYNSFEVIIMSKINM